MSTLGLLPVYLSKSFGETTNQQSGSTNVDLRLTKSVNCFERVPLNL
jgi:hypothetical protein